MLTQIAASQIITWSPLFLTEEDSVTIVYDAALGNAGLKDYNGDVYAHTGVITSESKTSSDWKYVKTTWGVNTSETRLERIGEDLYQFKIKPDIREFYGIARNESVIQLAFVFRSASSPYKEGKTAAYGDIFLPLYQGLEILQPSSEYAFLSEGDTLPVVAVASPQTDSLVLKCNKERFYSVANDTLSCNLSSLDAAKYEFSIHAFEEGAITASDSFGIVIRSESTIEALPEDVKDGVTLLANQSAILSLNAPDKEFVYAIGDFSNWEPDPQFLMKQTPDSSRFWLTLNNLNSGEEIRYQYWVDGKLKIADPYAEKILDPWNDSYIEETTYPALIAYPTGKTEEIVSVFQTTPESYSWQVEEFNRPESNDLVIYELLLRDFLHTHDFKTLTDTLNYLSNLGINAIELMPVNEFEGNESWGYNPSFYFAVDKYYGPADDLKKFVDACHQKGIAVILDMVLNHAYGQCPLVRLYSESETNPWFNKVSPNPVYAWGYDFNHESQFTRDFVDRVLEFWVEEYKIDGYRLDFTKGWTNTKGEGWAKDPARIQILKRTADALWNEHPGVYLILEHFAANTEEKELSDYGFLIWGNMNTPYSQSAMGWLEDASRSSDLSSGYFRSRGWTTPGLVTYMESHDEPWLMYETLQYGNVLNSNYRIQELSVALNRIKLDAVFFLTLPGPKMLWQFGELGYDQNLPESGHERVAPKLILWGYYKDPRRLNLYQTLSSILELRSKHSIFRNPNAEVTLSVGQGTEGRRIQLKDSTMTAIILGNFGIHETDVQPSFNRLGYWYDFFSGDSVYISDVAKHIDLAPGEYHIYTDHQLEKPEITSDVPSVKRGNSSFKLYPNYPNPFNVSTMINYQLPLASEVQLVIYDILGQKIKTLINQNHNAGAYTVYWNATDENNHPVSSGVYIYQLKTENQILQRKLLLIK